jgi:HEAT repeat protein
MMNDYDDDFLDEADDWDELDLEDDYHLELPIEELDKDEDYINTRMAIKPSIEELEGLLASGDDFGLSHHTILVNGLSDLTLDDARKLYPHWETLPTHKRQAVLEQLVDSIEHDYMLDYRSWAMVTLADPDPQVRASAVELLWDDESIDTLHTLIELIRTEKSIEVRSAAFGILGRFILLGEYEELDHAQIRHAQTLAYETWYNHQEPVEVRRRALEAFANCTDERLPDMIAEAYKSHLPEMQVSALFAMGRSYDSRWNSTVIKELDNEDPKIRYEAVRAAGELELKQAVQRLGKIARDERDREIMLMAVWSLGEIGGDLATRVLGRLADEAEDREDDDLIEAIEEAMDTASLGGLDL